MRKPETYIRHARSELHTAAAIAYNNGNTDLAKNIEPILDELFRLSEGHEPHTCGRFYPTGPCVRCAEDDPYNPNNPGAPS